MTLHKDDKTIITPTQTNNVATFVPPARVGDKVIIKITKSGQPVAVPMQRPVVGDQVIVDPYKGADTHLIAYRTEQFDYPFDVFNITDGNRNAQYKWYHGDDRDECTTTRQPWGWDKNYHQLGAWSDPVANIRLVTEGMPEGYCQVWFVYTGGTHYNPTYPTNVFWYHDALFWRIGEHEVPICLNPWATYPDANGVYAATIRYLPPFDIAPVIGANWTVVSSSGMNLVSGMLSNGIYSLPALGPCPYLCAGYDYLQVITGSGSWNWAAEFTDTVVASGLRGTLVIARTYVDSGGFNYGTTIANAYTVDVMVNNTIVSTLSIQFSNSTNLAAADFNVDFAEPITNPTLRIGMHMTGSSLLVRGPAHIIAELFMPAWKVTPTE